MTETGTILEWVTKQPNYKAGPNHLSHYFDYNEIRCAGIGTKIGTFESLQIFPCDASLDIGGGCGIGITKTFKNTEGREKNYNSALQKVIAVQDDSLHWYVIPEGMITIFHELEGKVDTESEFMEKFIRYRAGGDLNLIQLYAEI